MIAAAQLLKNPARGPRVVPKVAKRGASFRGAAAYYLHDKGAATNRRVAFCQTENLPVAEPELAWRWMAYTAKHADVLKTDARVAPTGRKQQKPVYTLSLSWSPEEAPGRDEMIAAAHSALNAIGLSKCQTLLVAHNDEPHPHIHAIVNLVDPDSGKVRDPGLDKRKLSRWAEDYEKGQGKIRCEQRVENNAKRDRGEPARDTVSRSRQDIEQARLIERAILEERRRSLWGRQVTDREALKQQAQERSQTIRAELKERFKPQWAAFYKKQRQDARDVKNARRSVLAAMRVAIKERRRLAPEGRAGIGTILAYTVSARALTDALTAAQERELAALRGAMNEARHAAVKAVWDRYGRDYRALKEAQAEARETPPPLPPPEEAEHRAALKAELEAKAVERGPAEAASAKPAREPEARAPTAPEGEARPEAARSEKSQPRKGSYDELTVATPKRAAAQPGKVEGEPGREEAQPHRKSEFRGRDYEALKAATPQRVPDAPAKTEEEKRREELKADFRRQAEEIARRRRERKHKDRDRDRER